MKYKKESFIFSIALLVVIIDQLAKLLASKNITSLPIITNVFHLTYIRNTGAAFGILQNQQWLLVWISIIVIGAILYYFDKLPKSKIAWTSIAFILGGTIGNLIDRIRLNYVIDFLDFRIWPAFNVADSALTVGAVILIIHLIKKK
ncbi:signal peptidase II [Candidatus Woesearchaeota archaeon]|nr:signal peptidase II [Candidatus Woesearchaeota archaeon]